MPASPSPSSSSASLPPLPQETPQDAPNTDPGSAAAADAHRYNNHDNDIDDHGALKKLHVETSPITSSTSFLDDIIPLPILRYPTKNLVRASLLPLYVGEHEQQERNQQRVTRGHEPIPVMNSHSSSSSSLDTPQHRPILRLASLSILIIFLVVIFFEGLTGAPLKSEGKPTAVRRSEHNSASESWLSREEAEMEKVLSGLTSLFTGDVHGWNGDGNSNEQVVIVSEEDGSETSYAHVDADHPGTSSNTSMSTFFSVASPSSESASGNLHLDLDTQWALEIALAADARSKKHSGKKGAEEEKKISKQQRGGWAKWVFVKGLRLDGLTQWEQGQMERNSMTMEEEEEGAGMQKQKEKEKKKMNKKRAARTRGGRYIFIGDIHSSLSPLRRLLHKLSFDPSLDTIIATGDVITKGPHPHETLDLLRRSNARGVRGNHDQKVIEWRGWMEDVGSGKKKGQGHKNADADENDNAESESWQSFVDVLDDQFNPQSRSSTLPAGEKRSKTTLTSSDETALLHHLDTLGARYPSNWDWGGEHFKIARHLSSANYKFLLSMPLVLHIPDLTAMVVHAGILPYDTTKHVDARSASDRERNAGDISNSHGDPLAFFAKVPQNQVPYHLLNIRSITKKGEPTKSNSGGTPWSKVWNEEMRRCASGSEGVEELGLSPETEEDIELIEEVDGRDSDQEHEPEGTETDSKSKRSQERAHAPNSPSTNTCSPTTIIYGHAAARGLDIKKYSKGLDTACANGKQLTALVVGDVHELKKMKKGKKTSVGGHDGVIVDVDCS